MTTTTHAATGALLLIAGALGGCDRNDAGTANDTNVATTGTATAANDAAPAAPPAADSPSFPLTLQQTSESGISVQLTSIQMVGAETVVGVKITNNYSRSAELNRKTYLAGGNGAQFKMRAPDGNEDLKVAPTQTLTGELVFEGRPAPGSDAVLVFNEGFNNSPYQVAPSMTFQIPLVQLGYK